MAAECASVLYPPFLPDTAALSAEIESLPALASEDIGEPSVPSSGVDSYGDCDGEPPVRSGDTVGDRYVVERLLGAGGMGFVYSGYQAELGTQVAIKFLRPALLGNARAVERFLDEARAAAELSSPHVVRILDVGRLESTVPFIVMEYLDGTDLETVLEREGALGAERAVDYVIQVCRALSEAHAKGLVHRDIKPENLVLAMMPGRRCAVKVVDFGIVKRLNAAFPRVPTGHDESVGSPSYMSPEQMTTPHKVDGQTDVWAVGVVLYRLLSSEQPFTGKSLVEICERILHAAPPRLHGRIVGVDPFLESIVDRCIEKERSRRYKTIDDVLFDLERWRDARTAACSELVASERAPGYVPARRGLRPGRGFAGALVFTAALSFALGFVAVSDDVALPAPASIPIPAVLPSAAAVREAFQTALTRARAFGRDLQAPEAPTLTPKRER